MAAPDILFVPSDYLDPLPLASCFLKPQPIEVEIGAGDGSWVLQYAAAHPERNFLAVERLMGRLNKILRKGARAGLLNLRAMRIDAPYFLRHLLPEGCVSALHVYFPDPWPKARHHKNRLINDAFPDVARRVLAPGGLLHLRTDDADYFEQMTTVFGAHADFEPVETPGELAAVRTDFERTFNDKGIPTRRESYRWKG
jgi:tRNA (guanine-N7-)-methyltransferase